MSRRELRREDTPGLRETFPQKQQNFSEQASYLHQRETSTKDSGEGRSVFGKAELVVSGLGSDLNLVFSRIGRDLDRWGSALETKVEELLPGWIPPASAFEQALPEVSKLGSQDLHWSDSKGRQEPQMPTPDKIWNHEWSTSDASGFTSPERSLLRGSQRQPHTARDSKDNQQRDQSVYLQRKCNQLQKENLALKEALKQQAHSRVDRAVLGDVSCSNKSMQSSFSPQRYHPPPQVEKQLEKTILSLLEKHEMLREKLFWVSLEKQELQERLDLMAMFNEGSEATEDV